MDSLTYYVLFAATVGGTVGLLFRLQESYSVRNAREAERKDEAVRRIEDERARLEYLNHVLRHEVLNNVSIINGYAELALDGPRDEWPEQGLETIRNQSREMAAVIQDVRTLIESLQTDPEDATGPVDLGEVLSTEIADQRATYGTVSVSAEIPEDLTVAADSLVARVFGNLLTNAVQHNDAETPRVGIIVEQSPETISVHVVDNGPGVSESKGATLFERSGRGDHGLGLYLASTILARYNGTIELTETGEDGSIFTVSLERWTEADAPTQTGPSPHLDSAIAEPRAAQPNRAD